MPEKSAKKIYVRPVASNPGIRNQYRRLLQKMVRELAEEVSNALKTQAVALRSSPIDGPGTAIRTCVCSILRFLIQTFGLYLRFPWENAVFSPFSQPEKHISTASRISDSEGSAPDTDKTAFSGRYRRAWCAATACRFSFRISLAVPRIGRPSASSSKSV